MWLAQVYTAIQGIIMSSMVESLRRQSLIQQKNSLTSEILNSSRSERNGDSSSEISRVAAETQLQAVNAELKALNKAKEKNKNNKRNAIDFYA